jgi:hypothetical protein
MATAIGYSACLLMGAILAARMGNRYAFPIGYLRTKADMILGWI